MSERLTDEQLYAMTVNLTPFKGRAPMSERLTDEQLREWLECYPEHPYAGQWSGQALIVELLALRARVEKLEAALTKIRDNDPDGWEASIARAALSETVEA